MESKYRFCVWKDMLDVGFSAYGRAEASQAVGGSVTAAVGGIWGGDSLLSSALFEDNF